MNQLIKPHLTERSMLQAKKGLYTFIVKPLADKKSLRAEIENRFNVTVKKITTIKIPAKIKRIGKSARLTKTSILKKAIVKLIKDQKIPLFDVTD